MYLSVLIVKKILCVYYQFFLPFSIFLLFFKILDLFAFGPTFYVWILKLFDLFQNCRPFCVYCQNFGLTIYVWILKTFDLLQNCGLFMLIVQILDLLFMRQLSKFWNFFKTVDLFALIVKILDLTFMRDSQNFWPFSKLWTYMHYSPNYVGHMLKNSI